MDVSDERDDSAQEKVNINGDDQVCYDLSSSISFFSNSLILFSMCCSLIFGVPVPYNSWLLVCLHHQLALLQQLLCLFPVSKD